jgi:hypothetical protein
MPCIYNNRTTHLTQACVELLALHTTDNVLSRYLAASVGILCVHAHADYLRKTLEVCLGVTEARIPWLMLLEQLPALVKGMKVKAQQREAKRVLQHFSEAVCQVCAEAFVQISQHASSSSSSSFSHSDSSSSASQSFQHALDRSHGSGAGGGACDLADALVLVLRVIAGWSENHEAFAIGMCVCV